MFRIVLCLLIAVLLVGGCMKKPAPTSMELRNVTSPAVKGQPDPAARGRLIFTDTEYTSTGLTCAHCHAQYAAGGEGHIFIAHSAAGMAARGTWWIMTPAQFAAKQGEAKTLVEAANRCIKAPYMNGAKVLEGSEGQALEAFLESIADPQAKDGKPFLIQRATVPPKAGLKADKVNGKRIYELSCAQCHGAVAHIDSLEGIGSTIVPLQLMAKVRGLADWQQAYKGKQYAALRPHLSPAALVWAGIGTAYAQEQPPVSGTGTAGAETAPNAMPPANLPQGYADNAMPWYALDILSDQDVVDVSYYICEDLKAPGASNEAGSAAPGAGSR